MVLPAKHLECTCLFLETPDFRDQKQGRHTKTYYESFLTAPTPILTVYLNAALSGVQEPTISKLSGVSVDSQFP